MEQNQRTENLLLGTYYEPLPLANCNVFPLKKTSQLTSTLLHNDRTSKQRYIPASQALRKYHRLLPRKDCPSYLVMALRALFDFY